MRERKTDKNHEMHGILGAAEPQPKRKDFMGA
jgi:hypothetical protein